MANNLGSLVVSLGLDAAEFTRGLSKSEYQTQQWSRRFTQGIEAVRAGMLGFTAAAGTALVALDRQAEGIAAFKGLGEQIGDTAEAVASLKTASDVSGVAIDTVAKASIKLTAALAATDDESKGVGAAIAAIGLEVEAFKSLSPVDQIEAVAKAFAGFEDDAGKTAVAVQLFGKSGAELIPLFNDLADGAERQVTLTQAQIDAADAYTKQTARLRSEVENLTQATAADAIPAMSQMVQMLDDVLKYSTSAGEGIGLMGAVMAATTTTMQALVVLGSDVAYVFRTIGDSIGAYAAVSARLLAGDLAGAKAVGQAYREMSEERRRGLDNFQRGVMNPVRFSADDQSAAEARRLGMTGSARPSISFTPTPPKVPKTPKAGKDPILEANDKEAGMLALLGRIDEAEERKALEALAPRRQLVIDEFEAVQKANTEYQALIDRLVDDTPTAKLEAQRVVMASLADEYERGRFGAVGSAEAVAKFGETASTYLGNAADKVKESNSAAQEFGLTMSSAFEEAIVSGKSFSDVVKGLTRDLIQMALRKAVIEPMAAGITGFATSFFSGASYDGGGYTGGGSRAGGLDGKGGFMAMLHPNETVVDHTKGQGMGGASVVQTFNIAGNADAVSVAQLKTVAKQIKAETLAAVQSNANRGGSFASSMGRA